MKTLSSLLFAFFAVTACNAEIISRASEYGAYSITFDTDTYSEWIDPYIVLGTNTNGCCTLYEEVLEELKPGGRFEGFQVATSTQVQRLLFGSFGIGPITAASSQTTTPADAAALKQAITFLDTTLGSGSAPNSPVQSDSHSWIMDARFIDDMTQQVWHIALFHSEQIHEFYTDSSGRYQIWQDLGPNNRSDPIGTFLVRVPEPGSLSLLAAGIAGWMWLRRRKAAQ